MSDEPTYRVRYRVEAWGQPVPAGEYDQVQSGVRVRKDNYGYTDELLLASILQDDAGQRSSILLVSESGPPSRDLLLAVREQIDRALVLQATPAWPDLSPAAQHLANLDDFNRTINTALAQGLAVNVPWQDQEDNECGEGILIPGLANTAKKIMRSLPDSERLRDVVVEQPIPTWPWFRELLDGLKSQLSEPPPDPYLVLMSGDEYARWLQWQDEYKNPNSYNDD